MSRHEVRALEEEWFDNIAAIIFNIRDVSNEEEEVVKALNDKYDALRDQLMLEALKQQMSDAEWAVLSEQERQAKLTKLKLMERRLRKEGKYDEAAALLGDAVKNSDLLQVGNKVNGNIQGTLTFFKISLYFRRVFIVLNCMLGMLTLFLLVFLNVVFLLIFPLF